MKRPTSDMPGASATTAEGAQLALLDATLQTERTRNRFVVRRALRAARAHFAAATAELKGEK